MISCTFTEIMSDAARLDKARSIDGHRRITSFSADFGIGEMPVARIRISHIFPGGEIKVRRKEYALSPYGGEQPKAEEGKNLWLRFSTGNANKISRLVEEGHDLLDGDVLRRKVNEAVDDDHA